MITMIIKSLIAFSISFVVLSFQVNNKPIFLHMTDVLGPLGTDIQASISKSLHRGVKKSSDIGKEFFKNAEPKYLDEINSGRSSLSNKKQDEIILEDIRKEEKRKLDEMINNE